MPDLEGRTALHHAVLYGEQQLTKRLLEQGADVNAEIVYPTYIHRCLFERRKGNKIPKSLWISPLHIAAGQGQTEIAKLLLDHGANMDVSSSAPSPISVATSQGQSGVVSVLLDRILEDSSVASLDDLPNDKRQSLFDEFVDAKDGSEGTTRVILDHGARSEAARTWGRRTIRNALGWGNAGTVKLLEEHGFTSD